MKRSAYILVVALVGTGLVSCDSLDYEPKGTISGDQLDTPERVEQLVTTAYSALGNDHWTVPYTSMWPYGNVRADDAYKGGGGTADVGDYNNYEQFTFIRSDQGLGDLMWFRLYVGVSRANEALRRLNDLTEAEFPAKTTRQAELRFIRGHFYFLLKVLYKHVPYITETVPEDSLNKISNRALSNDALWDRVADEFRFAANNLPPVQPAAGRANQIAAKAYLAKVLLYQAYEQDDRHNVTNVDPTKLQEVVRLADEVIGSGKFDLFDDYAKNFLWDFDNGVESVFAVQMSLGDGTPNGRVDMGNGLNYPMSGGFGCCWFHIPSQNLVNAFQTDQDGLPKFDTYNLTSLVDSVDFRTNTVDPRLDHTVSIPAHPFKYDPNLIYNTSWARVPQVYGPYSTMKELQHPACPCLTAVGPFFASSKNVSVIRYADVLLWKAEALIELGRVAEGVELINRIRMRAKNSTGRLKYPDGSFVSNYRIEPYPIGLSQVEAREALRWERRLEFALEGYRFFDLVRWGIAAETLNAYLDVEKTRHEYLQNARFTKNRDEYLPIPEQQIDFSEGIYEQNPGF